MVKADRYWILMGRGYQSKLEFLSAPGRSMQGLLTTSLLATLLLGSAALADQNDPRLEELFKQLHDAPDMDAAAGLNMMIQRPAS